MPAPAARENSALPSSRERLLLLALCAALLHLAFFRGGTFIYQFHKASSGAWMDEAARVLDGEVMYRDFTDEVGPGIVHLNAVLLAVFGRRLAVLGYAGLCTGCALGLALHALSARLGPAPWRLLPPALGVAVVYVPFDFGHPRWPALVLGLLALERLAKGPPDRGRALLAGLLLGVGAVFAFDVAAALALGAALHLASGGGGQRPMLVAFVAAVAAPVLAVLACFGAMAGVPAVAGAWWLGPLRQRLSLPGLGMSAHWGIRPAALLALALASLAAVALAVVRRGRSAEGAAARPVVAAGLALAAFSLVGPVDSYTLAVHALPLSALLAAALPAALRAGAAMRGAARAVLAVLLLGLAHASAGTVVLRQWVQPLVRQRFRAGEAWLGAPNVELAWLEREALPGARVFVFPAGAGAYFLTQTRNATPFAYAIEGRFDEDRQRRALAAIEATRPAAGLWLGGQQSAAPGHGGLDTLYAGILRAYRTVSRGPDGTLMLRRASEPPG